MSNETIEQRGEISQFDMMRHRADIWRLLPPVPEGYRRESVQTTENYANRSTHYLIINRRINMGWHRFGATGTVRQTITVKRPVPEPELELENRPRRNILRPKVGS